MRIPNNFVIPVPEGYRGHPHFWERVMSRRQFVGTTALVGGAVVTAPLWSSIVADAAGLPEPRPIPQTFDDSPFHFQFLTTTTEPSAITDFKGVIGGADLLGTGWGVDTATDKKTFMWTAIDNRFMHGTYVGVDGQQHQATFGFV
jgi:hypothetical protein